MPAQAFHGKLEQVDATCWRIPRAYKPGMRVDGLIFTDERLLEHIRSDQAPEQVANVAYLPGIQRASLAMPDIHWGYGFCIGGVCATDPAEGGVVSPGGVGYDINCGVRMVRTSLDEKEVTSWLHALMDDLFRSVPAGVGRKGKYHFSRGELTKLMRQGVGFLHGRGLATDDDLDCTEANGCIEDARPQEVSDRAYERGADQCGTVGAGNHFVEVQVVDSVADEIKASAMGLRKGQVCVLIHSGSRGLGYQVCDDALRMLRDAPAQYGIELPDRQLVCAPIESPHGQRYLGAMRAAANFAFCNRQLLMWQVREVFERVFGRPWPQLEMELVYSTRSTVRRSSSACTARGRPGPSPPAVRRSPAATGTSASP
jgi:tRNA-splicing ligase RtcB